LLALDFKPPIHPPLVGVLDPTVGYLVAIDIGYAIYGDRMCCNYDVLDADKHQKIGRMVR